MTASASTVDSTGPGEAVPPAPTANALRVGAGIRFLRTVATLIGGTAGLLIAWSNPDRGIENGWYAWAALGTFLGLVSGSSFGSGIARLRDIAAVQRVGVPRVAIPVLVFLALAGGAVWLSRIVVGPQVSWRGIAYAIIAIVGATPAGAALGAIRVLALDGLRGTPGHQLSGLIRLRRLIIRLLAILGSLVVLLLLVNAAGLSWGRTGTIPASAVIFAGGAGTVLVGLIYIPTASLLRRRSAAFIDEQFPLAGVDRAHLVSAAEDRIKLETVLGLDRTTLGELQAALLIVAPVLASAALNLIPLFPF